MPTGTTGADTLTGSAVDDSIEGLAGSDSISGLGGKDTLLGGDGNDTIEGGDHNDSIAGGDGNDSLTGGNDSDRFVFNTTASASNIDEITDFATTTDKILLESQYFSAFAALGAIPSGSFVQSSTPTAADSDDYILYNNTTGALYYDYDGNGSGTAVQFAKLSGFVAVTLAASDIEVFASTFNDPNTNGDNSLIGGSGGPDIINGLGGKDKLSGGAGHDTLNGGDGNDTLDGGSGNDELNGGNDTDTASYDSASAAVTVSLATAGAQNTGYGTDTLSSIENLVGSAYADTLTGDSSANVLEGGLGHDTLDGGSGVDTATYLSATSGVEVNLANTAPQATGGAGNDTLSNIENLIGTNFHDHLTGDTNDNALYGNGDDDELAGAAGNDTLEGGAGADSLSGGAGNDSLVGGAGNDTVWGGDGNDAMDGGDDTDTLNYSDASAAVTVNLALTTAQNTNGAGTDTWVNFENLTGSGFADTLTGSSTANSIVGGAGNDTISGGDGSDTLDGGTDTDLVTYASATSAVTVSLASPNAQSTGGGGTDTLSNFENLTGSDFADTLTGTSTANAIVGGGGNDLITGGDGNDTLDGGADADTASYSDATAAVTVSLALTTAQNTSGAGTDTLTNMENLTGSGFADTLTGSSTANAIVGGAGNDAINGGNGNDTLDGGADTDLVTYSDASAAVTVSLALTTAQNTGGSATDTLSNIENLTGSGFGDTLTGSSTANAIVGGAGNDVINGGDGNDSLTGGADSDKFAFSHTPNATTNNDTITDFTSGTDKISLDNAVFTSLSGIGALPASRFRSGAGTTAAVDSDDFLIYNTTTGALYYDADGSGSGSSPIQFATLSGLVVADIDVSGQANASLTGSGADDTLHGGTGHDTLSGGAGNDSLDGAAGNDNLSGGTGNDTLEGGTGNDTMAGADGNDTYYVDSTTDSVTEVASEGVDTVYTTVASYTLPANVENLTSSSTTGASLTGNADANILTGHTGADTLSGADGNDSISGAAGTDSLYGGLGNDTLIGGADADKFVFNTALGAANRDTITDFATDDKIQLDNSVFTALAGSGAISASVLRAGEGFTTAADADDYLIYDDTNGSLYYDADGSGSGSSPVLFATLSNNFALSASHIELSGVAGQTLTGTTGADVFTGGAGNDTITGAGDNDSLNGAAGNDNLDGGEGNDTLNGGTGVDTMAGGNGDDTYYVDSTADVVTELASAGTDRVRSSISTATYTLGNNIEEGLIENTGDMTGNALDNYIYAGTGNNSIDGGAGVDTVDYYYGNSSGSAGVTVSLAASGNQTVPGSGTDVLVNIENLYGTASADNLTGNTGNNYLSGRNAGNDTLSGGDGNDTLMGGVDLDSLDGGAGNDSLVGSSGNDTLIGGDGDDTLSGGTETDTVSYAGASAAITVSLALTSAQATGGAGSDTLSAIENLTGSAQGDQLTGSTGANSISGGAGNDTIQGDLGNDTLTGGADNDKFVFNAALSSSGNVDSITDFTLLTDKLVLNTAVFVALPASGTLASGLLYTYNSSEAVLGGADADDYLLYNQFDGNLYYDADGTGGGNPVLFATLSTKPLLTAADIEVAVGNASLTGTGGADTLKGGLGNDTLSGLVGADSLSGGAGNDSLDGADGNDTLDGGTGNDTLVGGDGNDLYYVDSANDVVTESNSDSVAGGSDTVSSSASSFTLTVNIETATITATGAANLTGNAGNNTINAGSGNNVIDGGDGNDTVSYSLASAVTGTTGVTVSLATSGAQATGGSGSDTLTSIEALFGSPYADSLTGDGSNNTLEGGSGNDSLSGGAGDDSLRESTGDDTIDGGTGNDTLSYPSVSSGITINLATTGAQNTVNAGMDTITGIENLVGGSGNDVFTGDSGANKLSGGAGNDSLTGGAGNDDLDGGSGNDTLVGGDGNDIYNVDSNDDVVTETNSDSSTGGSDHVITTTASYTLGNNVENGTISSTGAANMTGNTLNNHISAGKGDNVIDGGAGNDTVNYSISSATNGTQGVTISLAVATAQNTGGSGSDTLANIENITGSSLADFLTGDNAANILDGGAGDDTLVAGDGNDSILESTGNDSIDGGAGTSDSLSFPSASSAITINLATTTAQNTGGAGTDTITNIENLFGGSANDVFTGDGNDNGLNGNAGNDSLSGGGGNDYLDGGSGSDTMVGGDGNDSYVVDNSGDVVTESNSDSSTGGKDHVTSSIASFTLPANVENGSINTTSAASMTGNGLDNHITAGKGDNVIDGGAGTDSVSYLSSNAATGGVTVSLAVTTAQSTGGSGSDTLTSIEKLIGSQYNDSLTGSTAKDTLEGGAGDDTVSGGDGDDEIIETGTGSDSLDGGGGNDTLGFSSMTAALTINLATTTAQNTGGAGTDTIINFENVSGGSGNDTLTGTGDSNTLYGAEGNDTLNGAAGNDILIGAEGNDSLTGGTGNDGFLFNKTLGGSNVDTITDFATGADKLYLFNGVFAALTTSGALAAASFRSGAGVTTASDSNDYVIYDTTTGNLYYDADGNVATTAPVLIANLSSLPTLAATDIEVTFNNITGGNSADSLSGTSGSDSLSGGGGDDTLSGGDGDDVLAGGTGNDSIVGGNGNDTASYSTATANTIVELRRSKAANDGEGGKDSLSSIENISGSSNSDTLLGDENANVIKGEAGNDLLFGFGGADTIFGGDGNDWLWGGAGNDSIDGGNGVDTVDFGYSSVAVNLSLSGSTANDGFGNPDKLVNIENLIGSKFNDIMSGDGNANRLEGLDGNDSLNGFSGNDTLIGGRGNDTLIAGSGVDELTGGSGNDTFEVDGNGGGTADTITDFTAGADKLSTIQIGGLPSGALAAGRFRAGAGFTTAGDADDYFIYNTSTGVLYYDTNPGDATAAVPLVTLTGNPTLTNTDITLYAN